MTKSLRKALVGSLACAGLLAATTLATAAYAASPARDEAPVARGPKADSLGANQAGREALGGAKVPLRKFPHTLNGPTILYDNGPFVTHPGGGGGGADASRLQNSTLLMNTLGLTASTQSAPNFRLADDFTVSDASGWDVDSVTVYCYQTNSGTTSTINDARLQIWDGAPNAGGTVVFGDTTTNRLLSTAWSNAYRDTETTVGNTARPIMEIVLDVGGFHLDPGTYWIDYKAGGTVASGPFCVPITITGQTTTGDALQFNEGTATWAAAMDTGTATPQGMPFVVEGSAEGNPAIALTKTVGTVPAVCATTDSVTVSTGTTVYYCYSVENTGDVTFEFHDLEDDVLGTLLSNEPITLAPGDTAEFIQADTATATVTNTGTWTAKEVVPGYQFDNTVAQGFTDISATGTPLNLGDDGTVAVSMPFSFELYGASSSQLCVSNNGNMAHGSATCSGAFTNEALPSVTLGGAAIVPFWDDLDSESGNVFHQSMGSAPNRAFIVQWHQRPHFPGPNANTVTFQAVLHETSNAINFYYLDTTFGDPGTDNGASATVGLQQSTAFANQYSFNTPASIPDNEAILASIAGGAEATASDTATVTIADPDISVDPTSLTGDAVPDQQITLPLDIENSGTGDLNWDFEESTPAPRTRGGGSIVNQPPNQGNGFFNDAACSLCGTGQQSIAENFHLDAPATVGTVTLWTGYFPGDVPNTTDHWTVIIHAAASAIPGAAIYTETDVAHVHTQTGVILFGVNEWEAVLTLATPQNLPAGDYFLEIFNDTGLGGSPDDVFWETGDLDPVAGLPGSAFAFETPGVAWNSDAVNNVAFQLDGPTGPCATPSDVPWLSVDPVSGTTGAAATTTVDVNADSTGLTEGTYEAILCLNSNDPDTPLIEIPVTFNVVADTMPFLDGFESGDTSAWSFVLP